MSVQEPEYPVIDTSALSRVLNVFTATTSDICTHPITPGRASSSSSKTKTPDPVPDPCTTNVSEKLAEHIEKMTLPGYVFAMPDQEAESLVWLSHTIVSLQGGIAAGKTTLSNGMAKCINIVGERHATGDVHKLKAAAFDEQAPMLLLFSSNPKQYAFAFQIDQLRMAQKAVVAAMAKTKKGYFCILDCGPWGNRAFALAHYLLGTISFEEMRYYDSQLRLTHPYRINYEVVLWVPPEEAFRRKNERNRSCEAGVTVEYLDLINRIILVLAFKELKNGTSRIIIINHERFLEPVTVIRRLVEARVWTSPIIEGNPCDIFYTSVDERRQLVKELYEKNHVHISSRMKPPASPSIGDIDAGGLLDSETK